MEQRQLSTKEAEIHEVFLLMLGEGYGIAEAAPMALRAHPSPDPEFVSWLNRQGAPAN